MKHSKTWFRSKSIMLFFLFILSTTYASAQSISSEVKKDFCHTDELLAKTLAEDSELQEKIDEQNSALRNYINNYISTNSPLAPAAGGGGGGSANYVIPVVIYIVHNNGPENISDLQIHSQLDRLNSEFSSHGVSFCLATEENGTPLPGTGADPGIIRIQNTLTDHLTTAEGTLKALSPLPADRYLRIWVVQDINNGSGIVGYARFPGTVPPALEGIVMRYDVFGDATTCGTCTGLIPSNDQGKVLAHEVGHYLNLYHTFQGGCTGTTAGTCDSQGDLICDTPPVAVANTGCPGSPVNSCTETPTDNNDLLDNHMDYTNDNCRNNFTAGQETRMICAINLFRSTLVSSPNLVYTGVQCTGGLFAAFSASNYNPCDGDLVTFDANNVLGVTYTWDFGDGSGPMTGDPVTHSFTPGGTTYTVTLTITDGTNTVSTSQQVYVSDCSPIASTQGHWYFGRYGAMDFSTGTAVGNNSAAVPTTINSNESAVSVSDNGGNLLFYANPSWVWDNTHTQMNVTALGGSSSSAQMAFTPDPANVNQYYLFIPPSGEQHGTAANFLKSAIVNVSAGTVSASTAVSVPAGVQISESITVVPHCNGTDYWVITHSYGNSTVRFYVHRVTSTGITNAAGVGSLPDVYPSTGNFTMFTGGAYYRGAQLKASRDGSMLALAGNGLATYEFDRNTGTISNEVILDPGTFRYYGCSFSPSGQYVYASAPSTGTVLNAFDLAGNLHASYPLAAHQMQLGPDDKLYVSHWSTNYVSAIPNPDDASPTYIPVAVNFAPIASSINTIFGCTPNMIDAVPAAALVPGFTCSISNCNEVIFDAPPCFSSYLWDFGDMTGHNIEDPAHTYANGTYTVSLTVGGTTVTKTITIGVSSAIAGPTTVCLNDANIFNYSASAGPGLIYNWSASGGTIGLNGNDNVDVTWTSLPGTLTLTVTDPATGCTSTTTINVIEDCSGGCDIDPNYYIAISAKDHCVHLFTDATIVGSGCTITSWHWDFGDGSTSSLQNPAHGFPTNGTYNVCLTVTAICNGQVCVKTICYKVPVDFCDPCDDLKPNYYVAISAKDRCTMLFTDATPVPNGCVITSWFWDFGDGNTSTLQSPWHTFPGDGNYTVCLTVTMQCGKKICKETYCMKIPVEGCDKQCDIKPNYYAAVSIKNHCTLLFTDASTVGSNCNIVSWNWNFGDGSTSTLQNPSHSFPSDGIYNVCLTVTAWCGNQLCTETICYPMWVIGCTKKCDIKPNYLISINPDMCTFYFDDITTVGKGCTPIGWSWDFGDGNTSTLQNPNHTYTANGTYSVCLTVTANCNGTICTETICYNVLVNGCNPCPCGLGPNFSFNTNNCTATFNSFVLTNGCTQITGYSWDFGDGNTSTSPNPSHTYSASGTYTVCLTVYGTNGFKSCVETICYKVDVQCNPCDCGVKPYFKFTESNCVASFTDLSLTNSCTSITDWFWDFGDGTTSTLQHPNHVYASPGTYTVCLTVVGNDGQKECKRTYCAKIDAKCQPCPCDVKAQFAHNVKKCQVDFYDLSTTSICSSITNWVWDFGDGTTSSSQNPTHFYTAPGNYVVCLYVYASNGQKVCKDKICYEVEVEECKKSAIANAPDSDDFAKNNGFDVTLFPNPFTDQLNIEINLDSDQKVDIQVFDSFGKRIAEITNTEMTAGNHSLQWNPNDNSLSSGMYFIAIQTNKGYEYHKVTFNK